MSAPTGDRERAQLLLDEARAETQWFTRAEVYRLLTFALADERARNVAWLREHDSTDFNGGLTWAADALEADDG